MEKFDFIINPDASYWNTIASEIVANEHWTICPGDYDALLKAYGKDNFRFIVAVTKDTKEAAGSVASCTYETESGNEPVTDIGLLYVRPAYRGIGLGLELFNRVLKEPKEAGRNTALMAVPSMSEKYAERHGFNNFGGTVHVIQAPASSIDLAHATSYGIRTVPADQVALSKLTVYDRKITGIANRAVYIEALLDQSGTVSRVATSDSGEVIGFGMLRRTFDKGLFLGPLYAANGATAEALVTELVKSVASPADFTRLEAHPVTAANRDLMMAVLNKLTSGNAKDLGVMTAQFTDGVVESSNDQIFGITDATLSFV